MCSSDLFPSHDTFIEELGNALSSTATYYNNLGGAYKSKGEYDKAIDYYKKALEIDLKTIGENNPNTAIVNVFSNINIALCTHPVNLYNSLS